MFMEKFTEITRSLGNAAGDPFANETQHGPVVSQTQFDVCLLLYVIATDLLIFSVSWDTSNLARKKELRLAWGGSAMAGRDTSSSRPSLRTVHPT